MIPTHWARLSLCLALSCRAVVQAATLTGEVVDDTTQRPIPSRIYLQSQAGQWLFPQSASPQGSAVRYKKRNWANTNAVEFHTTLSAHPFRIELEPGRSIHLM